MPRASLPGTVGVMEGIHRGGDRDRTHSKSQESIRKARECVDHRLMVTYIKKPLRNTFHSIFNLLFGMTMMMLVS